MSLSKFKFAKMLVIFGTTFLLVSPLIWIFSISLQPTDAIFGGNFELLPNDFSLESFKRTIIENERGIRHSILFSFGHGLLATTLSMFMALNAVFLVRLETISSKSKFRVLFGSFSLYFLPFFILIPGLQKLSSFFEITPEILYLITSAIYGYVICFILLLLIYAGSKTALLEQLLLDTGGRLRAFIQYIFGHYQYETAFVYGLTFATIWSEFFVSGILTGTSDTRPFSVALLTAKGQYSTDYSLFAAGAVISFFLFAIVTVLFSMLPKLMFDQTITLDRRKKK